MHYLGIFFYLPVYLAAVIGGIGQCNIKDDGLVTLFCLVYAIGIGLGLGYLYIKLFKRK